MSFFVTAQGTTFNLRLDMWNWLEENEINGNYQRGGWSDGMVNRVLPHVEFVYEEDALAFKLKFGGSFSTSIPIENRGFNVEVDSEFDDELPF